MKTSKVRLQAIVDHINEITKSPIAPYTKTKDGKFKANAGNYHLDWAYGGVKLVRMDNVFGGVSDVTCGFVSKPKLDELLCTYRQGLLDGAK